MNRVKLTDNVVGRTTLPADKADLIVWDSEVIGFGLRVRPSGKSWILAYRPAGAGRSANMRKLRLGTPDVCTASEARNLARIELGKVAGGADPMAQRKEKRRKEKATLSGLIDAYEKDLERRRYVNGKLVANGLRTKMKELLSRDVREITGADLATIIARYEQAGRPGAGADFRSRCRAFFTWLVTKPKIIFINPLAGFRKERATRADRIERAQHGRALSDEELVRVWKAADIETAFGRFMRFLILTGCRRGEGAGLAWSMVDNKEGVLSFPAVFTKQGRGHVVPVSTALADVLEKCPIDARSDLVFASPRSGGRLLGYTQLQSKFVRGCGVDFRFHDLRRTFRTGLSRLGVPTEVAEIALGHAREDLERIYNRDDAVDRLKDALRTWADHVLKMVAAAETQRAPATVVDAMETREGVFG